MGRPDITILTATYNQAAYLQESLDSALAQDIPSEQVEILVVDDGSTDGTPSILRSYKDKIKVLTQPNQGLVAACNRGIQDARGYYLTRLDSDDRVCSEWLPTLLPHMKAGVACVYPDRYDFHPDGRQERIRVPENNLYELIACGSLFRTEDLRKIGGFRQLYWEEYDLYLRLSQLGIFIHVCEPLYLYRKHTASMTSLLENRMNGWQELIKAWGPEILLAKGRNPELAAALELLRAKEVRHEG